MASKPYKDDRKRLVLEQLAATDRVTHSCDAVGITSTTYYRWEQEDPEFAAGIKQARKRYRDLIMKVLQSRVIDGWVEKTTTRTDRAGNVTVETTRKFANDLLGKEASRIEPEFRERQEIDLKHSGGVIVAPAGVSPADIKDELAALATAANAERD